MAPDFFFNVFDDHLLAVRLVKQIRAFHPDSHVLVVGDGPIDRATLVTLRRAGAIVLEGRPLKAKGGYTFTQRNLQAILRYTQSDLVIKLDPDTYLCRPFRSFPQADWFGKIVAMDWFSDQIPIRGAHGCCWGMSRRLIERLLTPGLLESLDRRYRDPSNISSKHGRKTPFEDSCMALACASLGVDPKPWPEIAHSYDGHFAPTQRFAAVHPNRTDDIQPTDDIKDSWNDRPMRQMAISATVACPVQCAYCPNTLHQRRYAGPRFMSLELFREVLAKLPQTVAIGFTGFSEVFLNPQAIAMAEYAAAEGYRVHAYTTLMGVSLPGLARLRKIPFSRFSIHLPDVTMNRSVMTEGYFEVVQAAIADPICSRQPLLKLADLVPEIASISGRVADWQDVVYSRAGNLPSEVRPIPSGASFRCSQNRQYMNVLLPNGEVALCCSDFGLAHVLGSLSSGTYAGLFRGPAFRQVEAAMKGGPEESICRGCELAVIRC